MVCLFFFFFDYRNTSYRRLLISFSFYLENRIEDPETEVALNLICVDGATRKTIDIPIRPRPVKDLLNEAQRKHNASSDKKYLEIDLKHRVREERKELNKAGNEITHYLNCTIYFHLIILSMIHSKSVHKNFVFFYCLKIANKFTLDCIAFENFIVSHNL